MSGGFQLEAPYQPTGDQPEAIEKLVQGILAGDKEQTLLGVTGSGKTFTMANVIAKLNRPTLVLAHNKTLAAQLCSEFKEFFPHNAVEYFVSYYDYYQPEAYIANTDTYIEKDSAINDEIEKLRHSATAALGERRDVIIVSSVSCIYTLGDPIDYKNMVISVRTGQQRDRDELIKKLVEIQYERNDVNFVRNKFRVRGDVVEVFPVYSGDTAIRIEFWGDEVDRITEINTLTGEVKNVVNHVAIYPASHYIVPQDKMAAALEQIRQECDERVAYFKANNKLIEAQRIAERTNYDIEMLQEIGFCKGIENYSRVISGRKPGSTPYTLLDYFPKDFLMFIDESHVTLPQVRGMYGGDHARKKNLIDYDLKTIKNVFFNGMNLASLTSQYCPNVDEELGKIAIEEVAEDMEEILKHFNELNGQLKDKMYKEKAEEIMKYIPMKMELFYERFDKECMEIPIFKYYDSYQLFQRISCASNEDIVLIKEKLLDRAEKYTKQIEPEMKNIKLLKQIIDDYVKGKNPSIKNVMLKEFSISLGYILDKYKISFLGKKEEKEEVEQ